MELTKAEEQAKNFFIKLICDGTFQSCHDMLNTEIPEWYNEQKFNDGQNFCEKNRFVLLDTLATGVIAVFSDIRSLQILNSTGRSSTAESARKRYVSTTLHIINWYKNELKSGSSALNSLNAVRKAHVVNSKASVLKGLGEIKQFELVLTGFGFFGFHLLRSDLTGVRFETEQDKENFIHLWAVFTRMIGVKDEFNICLLPINVLEILGRMLIRYILIPNIQLEYPIFKTMVRAITEGLGEFDSMFTYESQLFIAKMLIGVPGYQYFSNYDNEILSKTELLNDDEINKLNQALKTHMDKEFNPITKNIPIYEDDSTAVHGKRIKKYVNYENEWEKCENVDNENKTRTQARIIGGENIASYDQSNYVVGCLIDDVQWCGGCIISSTLTLTAAHCLKDKNNAKLYFGYIQLSAPPSNAVSMDIHHDNFVIHPDYDAITLENDIGVIQLTQRLSFSSYIIQPIPIFSHSDESSYSLESGSAMLCGWGVTSDSSTTLSDYLQYVVVDLISYDTCRAKYSTLTHSNLCTSSSSSYPKGGCGGDSGGPLVANINGKIKLIGLFSFTSTNGCESTDPRGYIKVVSYLDWLCQEFNVCGS